VDKTDRRVQRTRQLLRDALMELILERGYDSIVIQDITDRANLGRATFYLHYRDKEDLLFDSLEQVFNELVKRIRDLQTQPGSTGTDPASLMMFEHAAENNVLYTVMLSARAVPTLQRRVRDYIAEVVRMRALALQPGLDKDPSVPLNLISNYAAGAMLGLVTWWLENDMPYPPDYMAEMLERLIREGTNGVFGPQVR